jgi:hypothetical protein
VVVSLAELSLRKAFVCPRGSRAARPQTAGSSGAAAHGRAKNPPRLLEVFQGQATSASWLAALGLSQTLEMAAVFPELMGQLDHSQSVRARADEFRREAHQRSDGDDPVGELERPGEGHVLFLYGLAHNKVSNSGLHAVQNVEAWGTVPAAQCLHVQCDRHEDHHPKRRTGRRGAAEGHPSTRRSLSRFRPGSKLQYNLTHRPAGSSISWHHFQRQAQSDNRTRSCGLATTSTTAPRRRRTWPTIVPPQWTDRSSVSRFRIISLTKAEQAELGRLETATRNTTTSHSAAERREAMRRSGEFVKRVADAHGLDSARCTIASDWRGVRLRYEEHTPSR